MWRDTADKYRMPLAVDNVGGSAGVLDVQVDLSDIEGDDFFWSTVTGVADGADLVWTGPNGRTLLAFEAPASWDQAARTGTVDIDDAPVGGAGVCVIWLYWGGAGSGTAAANTVASPADAFMFSSAPAGSYAFKPEAEGAGAPSQTVVKTAAEAFLVWWDITPALLTVVNEQAKGLNRIEEVAFWSTTVLDNAGSAAASLFDMTEDRCFESKDHRFYIGTFLQAGSDGSVYTISLTVTTTLGRVLNGRIRVVVQDTLAT